MENNFINGIKKGLEKLLEHKSSSLDSPKILTSPNWYDTAMGNAAVALSCFFCVFLAAHCQRKDTELNQLP